MNWINIALTTQGLSILGMLWMHYNQIRIDRMMRERVKDLEAGFKLLNQALTGLQWSEASRMYKQHPADYTLQLLRGYTDAWKDSTSNPEMKSIIETLFATATAGAETLSQTSASPSAATQQMPPGSGQGPDSPSAPELCIEYRFPEPLSVRAGDRLVIRGSTAQPTVQVERVAATSESKKVKVGYLFREPQIFNPGDRIELAWGMPLVIHRRIDPMHKKCVECKWPVGDKDLDQYDHDPSCSSQRAEPHRVAGEYEMYARTDETQLCTCGAEGTEGELARDHAVWCPIRYLTAEQRAHVERELARDRDDTRVATAQDMEGLLAKDEKIGPSDLTPVTGKVK